MFNPSRDDVRRFFCEAWRKHRAGELLTPLEATALRWIDVHPEYHALLEDAERALAEDFTVVRGQTNPFLHLSMHLALDEQLSIDQPPGIRAAFARLAARTGADHPAAHEAMECLGDVVWQAQRSSLPADPAAINAAYLDCLARRASR
jgi:elongation factor P--beta-lysine ligase